MAIKTSPSDPEPYVILGNIALQERRVAEATMDFDKAKQMLATYTNDERKGAMEQQTMSGIAQVAEADEDWKEAEARLRDLLKLAPEDLVAHQRLARALFWQGNAKDAYEILKAAKKIDPRMPRRTRRGRVFLTPEAIMAQYYDQYERPEDRRMPRSGSRPPLKRLPTICPPARSWPSGPWKKASSPLPRSRRRPP